MATFKGTHITEIDSYGVVESRLHGGVVRSFIDQFELADTANDDIAIVFKIPVEAVIPSIKFACDDLGTEGDIDIGFFKKNNDGTYTVVDADAFVDGIDASSAVSLTEYRFNAKGIETADQPAWELAGLTAQPDYADIYIGLTTTAGTTTAGTVMLQMTAVF